MSNDPAITNEELSAFIDGELDPARMAEIANLIAGDTALAVRIAAFRSDKERLLHIYGPFRTLPLPPKWKQLVEDRPAPPRSAFSTPYSRRGIAALAASLLLIVVAGLSYERFLAPMEDGIVEEALAARADTMHAEQSIAVATLKMPDAGDQVLSTTLMMPLKAPDLTKLGYRLENLRVYSGVPGGKSVEIGYRDEQNHVFTLYLRHPSGPARVDLVQRGGMRLCIWQDDVLGTVMLGEMSAGEMARIASLAYSGLTL